MSLYKDIKSLFTLPTAYEDWKDYRQQLTKYVVDNSNKTCVPLYFAANTDADSLLPTLAIIGAGSCNDLDLRELLNHFSKITLIDYDETAMKSALTTYGLADCPRVACIVTSLNGLTDTHYEKFCSELQAYLLLQGNHISLHDFEEHALTLLESLLKEVSEYQIPLKPQSYDYVCCFGVHSQLQAMFSYIYRIFLLHIKKNSTCKTTSALNAIDNRLRQENTSFIPRFHDALLSCTKSTLFIGCEQKRTSMEGAIEGAFQGISDIKLRYPDLKHTTLLWNFLPLDNIVYEMALMKMIV